MDSIVIKSSPLPISPQKVNLVAGLIRKKELSQFLLTQLSFLPKKRIGREFQKLLQGVIKNLIKNKEEVSNFYLRRVEVNPGRIQKKIIYRAKGRADRVRKRYSSIKIYIERKNKPIPSVK
ncbi:MAG: uL22 family ribosomal protein [Candidatus Moeniiplasma glomeromycotorum]|nr:uL22 family ribosomal protein [Candidatus Moeniiplasma glomeromycotorum]MCE8169874.1 uL22 family ribosomal protein [Candidatus Moeniiplasma glomeromycotorum]